jgi:branched-chain amino acid aminotransferase
MQLISYNGEIIPRDSVSISLDDRGFRFGDGVFETVAIVGSVPYLWQEHVARLCRGLSILSITSPLDHVSEHLAELIARNGIIDGLARVIVTRGCGSQGYLPTGEGGATVLLEVMNAPPTLAVHASPLTMFRTQWRRFPPECLPTDAKIMQGMNATLARMEAATQGCDEALMLSMDGMICEAASGNLFWLHENVLCTPALTTGCLHGTMRQRLMQLWKAPVQEVCLSLEDWKRLSPSSCVMTNALRGAVAVAEIFNESIHFTESDVLALRCNHLIEEDILRERSGEWKKVIAETVK